MIFIFERRSNEIWRRPTAIKPRIGNTGINDFQDGPFPRFNPVLDKSVYMFISKGIPDNYQTICLQQPVPEFYKHRQKRPTWTKFSSQSEHEPHRLQIPPQAIIKKIVIIFSIGHFRGILRSSPTFNPRVTPVY